MADIRIQLSEDSYCLSIDGETSEAASYGEPLEAHLGGKHYLAFADVDEKDDEQVESALDSWVYEIAAAHNEPEVTIEDVDMNESEDEGASEDEQEGS